MISKIWKFIKILFWPILFGIGQFFICGLFIIIYLLQNPDVDTNSLHVNEYINDHTLLIALIECIIFIPIFYSVYKKYCIDKDKYSIKTILVFVLIPFLLSIILNFIIIALKSYLKIDMTASITLTSIITTGIIGPILEELLFRGIVYGKFLHIFKEKLAFYLSIFVFAVFHTGGIFQILFAAVIGYYLTYLYRKYGDLRISMLAHIVVNITSIVVSPFILGLF